MKRDRSVSSGIGSGYVTIIMIFVVICLTVLAALSFSAAGSNEQLGERSRRQMTAYYEADSKAKQILSEVDLAAYEARESGFFDGFLFEQGIAELDGVSASKSPDGYSVKWDTQITERLTLSCEVKVFSDPESHGGRRYSTEKWNSTSATENKEQILNVWDGSSF